MKITALPTLPNFDAHFAKKNSAKCPMLSAKWDLAKRAYTLPGMVCYAEKQEKLSWFSSLGQTVQFGAIIFCRTFKNYFGQFVWIEKKSHYNSRVSLHEAPTKNGIRTICVLMVKNN